MAGTQALAGAQFNVAVALGVNSQPAGFAPSLYKSGDIGKVDPTLAAIMASMTKMARSAAIQSAVKKAGALKAMRATAVNATLSTEACSNADAVISINGTNNYDESANPAVTSSYDINFKNCQDDIEFMPLNGDLHIESVKSTDNNGVTSTVIAKALTQKTFSAADFAVLTQTSVMDGSFISDNQVTAGANSSTGTFVVTTPAQGAVPEKVATFNYDGLVVQSTFTHNADGTDTTATTTKGSFSVSSTTGGNPTFKLDLALNLTDVTLDLNDAAGTRTTR